MPEKCQNDRIGLLFPETAEFEIPVMPFAQDGSPAKQYNTRIGPDDGFQGNFIRRADFIGRIEGFPESIDLILRGGGQQEIFVAFASVLRWLPY